MFFDAAQFVPLIAAVGPGDHPYLVYIAIGGVWAALGIFNAFTGGLLNVRRLRERGAEANYVSQTQLREVHQRVDLFGIELGKVRGEVTEVLRETKDETTRELREVIAQLSGIQRSLGQVEGLARIIEEHGRDIDGLQRGKPRS